MKSLRHAHVFRRARLALLLAVLLLGIQIGGVSAQTNLLSNGDFSVPIGSPDGNWGTFPQDGTFIFDQVGGVFRFYTGFSGVVLQRSGDAIGAGAGVEITLELGNNSTEFRRRATVIAWDSNFSDLRVCTFWILPNTPLQQRKMHFRTAQAWTNAQISIYASTVTQDGSFYLLDNVSMHLNENVPFETTQCTDPLTPAAGAGADGANLANNGSFTSPISNGITNWGIFPEDGTVQTQIVGQTFNYYRTMASTSGVVLQDTQQFVPINSLIEATFMLGNSTPTTQRVTILLHSSFVDLQVCTFWIPAGSALSPYTMRAFTLRQWNPGISPGYGANISFYASTPAASGWILIDDVVYRQRPSLNIPGTTCFKNNEVVLPGAPPAFAAPLAIPPQIAAPESIVPAEGTLSEGTLGEGTLSEGTISE
jgi:hypothetical protein